MGLCEVELSKGLTIITGETGAGKTALTQGLKLLIGERADSNLVRKGEDKAHVEASFDISLMTNISEKLIEYGIDHNTQDPLVITREISKDGKSRAFINRQAVTVSTLQSIGSMLVDMIGQHSYHELRSSENQREILDIFCESKLELVNFQSIYSKLKQVNKDLRDLEALSLDKERNYQKVLDELSEIDQAKLKEGEDEKLFELYCFHSQSQEISACCKQICNNITESPSSVIRILSQGKNQLYNLLKAFPNFEKQIQSLQEAIITLQDVAHELNKTLSSIEHSPLALEKIEQRLSVYTKIKRRYGQSFNEWMAFKSCLESKIEEYDMLDEKIQESLKEKKDLESLLDDKARLLSRKRRLGAEKLKEQLTLSIQQLNMPKAKVYIEIKHQDRTFYGDDHVSFWLEANPGESPSSLKDNSSGGELSRILLAIKTSLAEKNNTPTIIFDEIDANVGGTTATLIGEKLLQLSKHRQVFCITHFAQVAKKADLHLRVSKQDVRERTEASIEKLSDSERQVELLRMLGEAKSPQHSS